MVTEGGKEEREGVVQDVDGRVRRNMKRQGRRRGRTYGQRGSRKGRRKKMYWRGGAGGMIKGKKEEEKVRAEEDLGLLTWVLSSPLSFSSSASRSPSLERLFSSSSQSACESWAVCDSRLCFWTWNSSRGTRRTTEDITVPHQHLGSDKMKETNSSCINTKPEQSLTNSMGNSLQNLRVLHRIFLPSSDWDT